MDAGFLGSGYAARGWVSRQVGRCEPGASQLGVPDFLAMSERFAGKVHHIEIFAGFRHVW